MGQILKIIVRAKRINVCLGDLGIVLKNIGDSIDLLQAKGFEEVMQSKSLDQAIVDDWIEMYDENGNLLSTVDAIRATNFSTLKGDPVSDYLYISAGSFISSATNGASILSNEFENNDVNLDYIYFIDTSKTYAEFSTLMPPNWDKGIVNCQFYWTYIADPLSGTKVEWEVSAKSKANDDAIDSTFGTAQVISDTIITNSDLHISEYTPDVTISGNLNFGNLINFKIARNTASSNDDMASPAFLLGVLVKYGVSF